MNKNRHRIIFNAARGHRMVVAETAGSQGGAAAGEAAPGSTRSPLADAAITDARIPPNAGISSTEIVRGPGHPGITKDLVQDPNVRVEHGTHEAEMHAGDGCTATGAQTRRQALAVRDVGWSRPTTCGGGVLIRCWRCSRGS